MANPNLFQSSRMPNAANHAGGKAFELPAKEALAHYAGSGMLGGTYYVSAKEQLDEALLLANRCEPAFVAKCAIYSREQAYLKDMPALLLANVMARGARLEFAQAFPRVIDNGKMLRNFVQIVRSGVTGRKSFGTHAKRQIQNWLLSRRPDQLLRDSVGKKPSLADVIKMVHPAHNEVFRYLLGKPTSELPSLIQQYETFKKGEGEIPNVDFRLLTSCPLTPEHWKQIARTAKWQMTRMNLNTFARHGVFEDKELVSLIAERLRSPEEVARAKCFPYQLLTAYKAIGSEIPRSIVGALHDALELATSNVPKFGRVVVCPDVSGSMRSLVTGQGSTSCTDVAGLVAAVMLRQAEECDVLPFDTRLHTDPRFEPRDSIMTTAQKIASFGGGGTYCELPLQAINQFGTKENLSQLDAVVYISDNESWMHGGGTLLAEWRKLKAKASQAKLVCIDIAANSTVQAPSRQNDVLNVAGFSDSVFSVMNDFLSGKSANWVDIIEAVAL